MSRDATGIYSRWAQRETACPSCGAAPGVACDMSVEGYAEHDVHWARVEAHGPFDPMSLPAPAGVVDEAVAAVATADAFGCLDILNSKLLEYDLRVVRTDRP